MKAVVERNCESTQWEEERSSCAKVSRCDVEEKKPVALWVTRWYQRKNRTARGGGVGGAQTSRLLAVPEWSTVSRM
jgi:hypothetical protein